MKKIRSLATLMGLWLVLLALGATGAKAQQAPSLSITHFAGTFTLPFEVQWGAMTLLAGDYNVYYGDVNGAGSYYVEVLGKAKGSSHGLIAAQTINPSAAAKSTLTCYREGTATIVQSLQMPAIGEAVTFAKPHGERLMGQQRNNNSNTQVAEAQVRIQRIPVSLSKK